MVIRSAEAMAFPLCSASYISILLMRPMSSPIKNIWFAANKHSTLSPTSVGAVMLKPAPVVVVDGARVPFLAR